MREKADLREANLNGAILADAKLGGACLDEGFLLRHLHRAASDIVTNSDVTRHTETTFNPDRCHGATGAYRLPSGPHHPYGFDADHSRQTRDDSSRCELQGPHPSAAS
jgi:uncharacterized protein YjbI with pentapeptide repeats